MYKKPMILSFSHLSVAQNSPRDLQVLGSLQRLYRCSEYGELIVSPEPIWFYLKNKMPSYDSKVSIIKSFDNLNCLTKVVDGFYKLNTECFEYDETFVSCDYEVFELLKNTPGILKHYLTILMHRSHNIEVMGKRNVICSLPISYFAEFEGVHENTISSYNRKLEDLKLIYIARDTYSEGRDSNYYSLYEDRKYVEAFIGNSNTGSMANWKRKVTGRYNRFINDPDCYSLEELEELLGDLKKYKGFTKNLTPLLDKIKALQYNIGEGRD